MAATATGTSAPSTPARSGLDAGRLLAALGALLLLVSLFLDWFELPGSFDGHDSISAWTAFEIVDLLLALLALAAIAPLAGLFLAGRERELVPERVGAVAGPLALLLVLAALIDHPPAANGFDPAVGIWLALAGALLMALGGLLAAARISLVVARREERIPAAAAPPAAETPTQPLAQDPQDRPAGI